jgi:hypothetical protein
LAGEQATISAPNPASKQRRTPQSGGDETGGDETGGDETGGDEIGMSPLVHRERCFDNRHNH